MAEPSRGRRVAAVAVAAVVYVTLLIAFLGAFSLVLDEDVISARGLGQLPGVIAVVVSVLGVVAAETWAGGRSSAVVGVVLVTASAFLAYLVGLGISAMTVSADAAATVGIVARAAASWPGVAVGASAFLAAWVAVGVRAMPGAGPSWPWEGRDNDE